MGNINNVYNAPARPSQPKAETPSPRLPPAAIIPTPVETKTEPAPAVVQNGIDIAKVSAKLLDIFGNINLFHLTLQTQVQAEQPKAAAEVSPGSPDPSLSTVVSRIGVEAVLPSSAQDGPVGSIVPVQYCP